MSLTRLWLRIDLRRSAASLVVLALLVTLVSATVLAAVGGVRRAASAQARLAALTLPADVLVAPQQPLDSDAIAALPEVATMDTFTEFGLSFEGIPVASGQGASPVEFVLPYGDSLLRTLERPVVLAGRLPDPARADEAAVTSGFVSAYHRGVGDTLRPGIAAIARPTGDVGLLPKQVRIVGVVRSPLISDDATSRGRIVLTPALGAIYRQINADAYIAPLVRLRPGGRAAFDRDLAAMPGGATASILDPADTIRRRQHVLDFENRFLLSFAGCVLLVGLVVVGQAVTRLTRQTVEDLGRMRAVGLTPRQLVGLAAAGPALAGLAGAVLGAAVAFGVSGAFPLGSAAAYEPDPGLHADLLVLLLGLLLVPAGVAAAAVAGGRLALAGRGRAPARSRLADRVARAGLPVPMVIGSRLALEQGTGRQTVAARSAQAGAVLGILGVVAALTFSGGVREALINPVRFGQTFQLSVTMAGDGTPTDIAVLAAIAADRDVASIDDSSTSGGSVSGLHGGRGTDVLLNRYQPAVGRPGVVVMAGRMPRTPDEIALGPESAATDGISVGDRIRLRSGSERALVVSGLALVPESWRSSYAEGAWLSGAGFAAVAGHEGGERVTLVSLRPGADVKTAAARLDAEMLTVTGNFAQKSRIQGLYRTEVAQEPVRVGEVRRVQAMPLVLGCFLGLLATAAVGLALASAVRRHRPELAVLRSVGMTPRQARSAIVVQALVLAVIGLAIGAPLGLSAGRLLWRLVAGYTPLQYASPEAWPVLEFTVPAALGLAVLLAAGPGVAAGRFRLAEVLRAE